MRHILTALLFCAFALASLPVSLSAQHVVPDTGKVPNNYHYVPPPAWKSVEIGNFYFRRKDYRGALSRYKEAAADDPYYAPAYLGLGKVYEKQGKNREALAAYRKYLDTLPSQKQADDATGVHKAIRRLERQLHREIKQSHGAPQPSSAAKD
ncbi:MAG: tetratricopeptide repeat protein [Acidobacteriota bacterium]